MLFQPWDRENIMIRLLMHQHRFRGSGRFFLLAQPASGQVDDSKLGKVHFETSCNPQVQKLFDRGLMLYEHSFWYHAPKNSLTMC